jgi:hypothetical protein
MRDAGDQPPQLDVANFPHTNATAEPQSHAVSHTARYPGLGRPFQQVGDAKAEEGARVRAKVRLLLLLLLLLLGLLLDIRH